MGAALAGTIAYSVSSMYALMLYCKMEGYSLHRLLLERTDLHWLQMRITGSIVGQTEIMTNKSRLYKSFPSDVIVSDRPYTLWLAKLVPQ
jgi:hypothetical protein